MFGIGLFEIMIIAVFAIIFVGPKKLPGLMKQLGQFFVQMREYSSGIKTEINDAIHDVRVDIDTTISEKKESSNRNNS